MAKAAKFQREEVIHNAMLLYWEKGFHATSMRALQDAIDMRPGSIYAEFGSKESLYQITLEHYAEQSVQRLTETVANAASPLQGLKQFVSDIVVPTDHPTPSNMCMLAKTVAELTEENSELLDSARKGLRRIEGEFANVIKAAQDTGDVDSSRDAQRLGQYVQIQIMGIRTYVRANQCDTHQTKALVDDIFALFI